jgi:hypothetical protein
MYEKPVKPRNPAFADAAIAEAADATKRTVFMGKPF